MLKTAVDFASAANSSSRVGKDLPVVYPDLASDLIPWFHENMRRLPWRGSYEAYEVWLSEIMLQQTQMERGTQYFESWLRRFPSIRSVAEAAPDAVLKAWEGLGYYSRVRNFQKAAKLVMERHDGRLPEDYASLRALPGIGEYTAGAILSIAFNQPVPAVDANVERVFARLFDIDAPVKSAAASDFIRHMAENLIPEGQARLFNQALMELGALVCSRTPKCEICPLAAHCQARRLGIAAERPVPRKKVSYEALEIISGALVHKGRIFLQKRLDSGVWAGFWEFPGGKLEQGESPDEGIVREFGEETDFQITVSKCLGTVRHAHTRYRIRMHCFLCSLSSACGPAEENGGYPVPSLNAATEYRWVRLEELYDEQGFTMPAGHRKFLDMWRPELERALMPSSGDADPIM